MRTTIKMLMVRKTPNTVTVKGPQPAGTGSFDYQCSGCDTIIAGGVSGTPDIARLIAFECPNCHALNAFPAPTSP